MSKVLLFLDSGQTIEVNLPNNVVNDMAERFKKYIINKDDSKVIWVESNTGPVLVVPINNILAIKVASK